MPTIYLIRHAQASFGAADYDVLSEVGHRQAVALDESLRARGVRADKVLRGSQRRQQQTMELCRIASVSQPVVDPRLDEYDHADLFEHYAPEAMAIWRGETGASNPSPAQIQALLDGALWRWAVDGEDSPSGESWPAFQARALGAVRDLTAALASGEQALAFTSAGIIAAVCTHLLSGAAEAFVALNRVAINTAVTTLTHGRAGTSLVSFNDHSHLEAAGRDLLTYR